RRERHRNRAISVSKATCEQAPQSARCAFPSRNAAQSVAGSARGLACIASDPLVGRHYTGIEDKGNTMTKRMRVSGTLGKQLKESKGFPDSGLCQAWLPLGLFQQSKIFLTTDEMFALYNAIEKISGDPGIGLKLGSDERPEHYSAIAIAALYTRSFRDAMERIARYKRLTGPQEIRIVERGKECAVEFLWLLAEKPEPLMLIDMCFAWAVAVGGRGTGHCINPLRVEFKRPPGNRRLYESHFRCPVTF